MGGVAPAKIYGVSWNKGSSPTLTRTDGAVGKVANAGVGMTPVVNDFDAAEIYKDITTVTDALGNVFIRIPKFYIEKTDGVGVKTWRISKQPFGSAYLPWCFWDFVNSRALDYVDVGKYPASRNGTSGNLESKPGVYPAVNRTIVQFRADAAANGTGYQQLDIHVLDMLQVLFYVEFATLNSQSVMAGYTTGQYTATHLAVVAESNTNRIIVANAVAALYAVGQAISVGTTQGGNQIFYGRNVVSIDVYDASNKAIVFDGAPVNISVGNLLYNTGWQNDFSGLITAKSGSLVSNTSGLYPMVYQGIENLWGNVWQFVDGVNINERQGWVTKNSADYASNLFTSPYEQLSYVDASADGYIVAMGWDVSRPYATLPVSADGSVSTYYSDYEYQATGQRIACVGGLWSYGDGAGLTCWGLNRASSLTYLNVGGRLLRKAL